jgi:hypothetical protein
MHPSHYSSNNGILIPLVAELGATLAALAVEEEEVGLEAI